MEHHLMRQLRLAFLGQKSSLEVCNRRIVPHLGAQPVHQLAGRTPYSTPQGGTKPNISLSSR